MPGVYSHTYKDYSGESSTVRVEGVPLTAANFDAQVTATNDLANSIAAVTLGQSNRLSLGTQTNVSSAASANPVASREGKWLVTFTDDTDPTRKLSSEIPCADITDALLRIPNTDIADLTEARWLNFVADFEAYTRAPTTGGTVSVQSIIFVGRNL